MGITHEEEVAIGEGACENSGLYMERVTSSTGTCRSSIISLCTVWSQRQCLDLYLTALDNTGISSEPVQYFLTVFAEMM
jgi:hypothetical protein